MLGSGTRTRPSSATKDAPAFADRDALLEEQLHGLGGHDADDIPQALADTAFLTADARVVPG